MTEFIETDMNAKALLGKIGAKDARIGVIGLGYVGLPLASAFCRAGFSVVGFDIDQGKIALLRSGVSYIRHVDISLLTGQAVEEGSGGPSHAHPLPFRATSDFSELRAMDCILICVPTPLDRNREPDMTHLIDTARTISEHLRKGQLIVLESTTYPGTTDTDMRAILEETGLMAGKDFFLAFSPEREDPGNKEFTLSTVPKLVGGYSDTCLMVAGALYETVAPRIVAVSSTRVAEAAKLLENIYRAVNIALVNELKILFDRMEIDVWEVIEAAKTKPFGFQAFYPGPGLGGHCIPIDPFYLTWKAKEYDFVTRFVELAGEINSSMPDFVVTKVVTALNDAGKPVKGSKILLLGLAYKANVDDDRESPTYRLMKKLEQMGAHADYHDPYIPVIRPTRAFPEFAGRKSSAISGDYDLLLIVTAHDEYRDIDFAAFHIPVVDTRNVVRGMSPLFYKA